MRRPHLRPGVWPQSSGRAGWMPGWHTSHPGCSTSGRQVCAAPTRPVLAAHRHCRSVVVTASMDSLQFLQPIGMGEVVLIESWVNCAFRTSVEVEVHVSSEEILTGKKKKTSTAFLTFVALDQNGQPRAVP